MAKVVCYVLSPKELPLAGKSFLEKDKLLLKRRFEETNSLRDMNVNECRQKLRLLIDENNWGRRDFASRYPTRQVYKSILDREANRIYRGLQIANSSHSRL